MTSSNSLKTGRVCVSCGRPIEWNSEVCEYCGHKYRKGGRILNFAGILVLISGLDFLMLFVWGGGGWEFFEFGYEGRVILMTAVLVSVAGILILKRRDFPLSSIGAILAWTMWLAHPDDFPALIGGTCGFVGFTLLMVSRKDFKERTGPEDEGRLRFWKRTESFKSTKDACRVCGKEMSVDWRSCPYCGSPTYVEEVQPKPPVCPSCGRAVKETWTKCPFCARQLGADTQERKR